VVQKISLIEIIRTCSAATSYGCRSSGVFYAIDSATLQPVHRCTPAPYGILAVPAVLPTTTTPSASVASTVAPTVVASAVASAPSSITSNSVPTLHPNLTLPIVLDTGSSIARTPFASDYTSASDFALEVTQAPYGLFRSASASVDLYALITGEDVSVDLSSPDTIVDSDSGPSCVIDLGPSFTKVYFDIRQFGTASLTFIFSPTLSLIKVFLTPTQVDWIHWSPLPRLILPESYFHVFGLDYLQAFTLFHLIPIWIYLLHFAVNLE